MLTDADIKRLQSIRPSSRQPDQLPRVLSPDGQLVAPPTAAGRHLRRDRIEEHLTERELFHGYGVPYDKGTP